MTDDHPARERHTRASQDAAPLDRRYGRLVIHWHADGRPLDRFDRDIDTVREHAAFVSELADELRTLAGRCVEEVLLGREAGPKFWGRFMANIAVLDRVADRDNRYVQALERAAERRADSYPVE